MIDVNRWVDGPVSVENSGLKLIEMKIMPVESNKQVKAKKALNKVNKESFKMKNKLFQNKIHLNKIIIWWIINKIINKMLIKA